MKYGGRTKGTPNKTTKELKEIFVQLVNKHLVSDIENLPPIKRLETLCKLLPYIMPNVKQDEHVHEHIEPLVIIVQRDDANPGKTDAEYIKDYNSAK